jgi:hypothetical protein
LIFDWTFKLAPRYPVRLRRGGSLAFLQDGSDFL